MRRIEMTWDDGEWDDGVADELIAEMLASLEAQSRVLPDMVKVVVADWRTAGITREFQVPPMSDQVELRRVKIGEGFHNG